MTSSSDRASYFPIIEKRYGKPISHWLRQMKKVAGLTYPEQMTFLQGQHGFSRTHANALVQYSRGSTTSRRFETVDDYLADHEPMKQETVRRILAVIEESFPDAQTVIAWNTPMVRRGDTYVFGVSVHNRHLLIAPYDTGVLDAFRHRLAGYELNKKTIKVPVDWDVDTQLIRDLVEASTAQVDYFD